NGAFTYTPASGFSGTDTFTYKANDGHLDSNVAMVTITVQPLNHPPVVLPLTCNLQAVVGQPFQCQVDATDPDGQPLTFTLLTAPTGMTITSAGLIQWTPTAAQVGSQPVTVQVQDTGGLSATQPFTVTVVAVGTIPVPDVVGQTLTEAETAITA